jgi:hypothetical protein
MEDSTLNRIAEALERIATSMENTERRGINISRKARIEESKKAKAVMMSEAKKHIRAKITEAKGSKKNK